MEEVILSLAYRPGYPTTSPKRPFSEQVPLKTMRSSFEMKRDWFKTSGDWFETNGDWCKTHHDRFETNDDWFETNDDRFETNDYRFETNGDSFEMNGDWLKTIERPLETKRGSFERRRVRKYDAALLRAFTSLLSA